MNLHTALVFGKSALRSAGYLLAGRIRFPRNRLGETLEMPDGNRFILYRETTLQPAVKDAREEGVVLVFEMQGADRTTGETLRSVLFDPLANVATPFFAGMPGFRRKLWLAGTRQGEFLELYEWATDDDASRFVQVLRSLLEPFDPLGSASFEVVEDDTVEEYVAARSLSWHDPGEPQPKQRRWRRTAKTGLLAMSLLFAAGYLAWKGRSRAP